MARWLLPLLLLAGAICGPAVDTTTATAAAGAGSFPGAAASDIVLQASDEVTVVAPPPASAPHSGDTCAQAVNATTPNAKPGPSAVLPATPAATVARPDREGVSAAPPSTASWCRGSRLGLTLADMSVLRL